MMIWLHPKTACCSAYGRKFQPRVRGMNISLYVIPHIYSTTIIIIMHIIFLNILL